jgi:predicted secreted protein with PEFG-CTERM motif
MSTRLNGFVILAILVAAAGTIPVFAASNSTNTQNTTQYPLPPNMMQNPTTTTTGVPITVTTDKTSYNDGDKLTISGTTQDYISGTPVSVIVRNPIGNVVQIAQVDLGSDRTYSTTITVGGSSLWQAAGTYEVDVQFGSKDRSAKTTFQFTGSNGGAPPGNTIKVDGTDFSVTYSITNGKVTGIKADVPSKSLIVSIQTTGDGQLTIDLPRALIDAKKSDNQTDDQFFVLNDGQEAQFTETTTTTDRTLTIPFTDGTEQIEIIGTWIVPEFGAIAALVLAIAIISIIAVSAKTGLRFMPKY